MPNQYATGYNGTTRTRAQLEAWPGWQNLDPEFRRRALAIMDASIVAGRPLGIGGTFRSAAGQEQLFLSRHHVVASGGCCTHRGKRYALNKGAAHAAVPGRSYHEGTTADGKALAIDWIGDLGYLKAHAAAFGLNEASTWPSKEPWHGQPAELPRGRSQYRVASMHPLAVFPIAGAPTPAPSPTKVFAPKPTLKVGRAANNKAEARALQTLCNFWKWRDALGRNLVVDGNYGERTAQAVVAMQRQLDEIALAAGGKRVTIDGEYGPQSAAALQSFLDAMTAFNSNG